MKSNKIYVIAAIFFLVGLSVIAATFAAVGFDSDKLGTLNYIDREFTAENEVLELDVDDSNTSVVFTPSDGDRVRITYVESEREKYNISQSGTTLRVEKKVSNMFYSFFNFDFGFHSRTMTVYLPEGTAVKLTARTSNSGVRVNGASFTELELKTSNGKLDVSDATCEGGAVLKTSNSSIYVSNLSSSGTLDCSSSNGKIEITGSKAESIFIDDSNSTVSLTSLAASVMRAQTSNGRIEVDDLDIGAELRLVSSNGSISGTLPGSINDYDITSSTSNGSNSLPEDMKLGDIVLYVRTSNASIGLDFSEQN